jgi:hypothetical protein
MLTSCEGRKRSQERLFRRLREDQIVLKVGAWASLVQLLKKRARRDRRSVRPSSGCTSSVIQPRLA